LRHLLLKFWEIGLGKGEGKPEKRLFKIYQYYGKMRNLSK
jgi:hypothetical protein